VRNSQLIDTEYPRLILDNIEFKFIKNKAIFQISFDKLCKDIGILDKYPNLSQKEFFAIQVRYSSDLMEKFIDKKDINKNDYKNKINKNNNQNKNKFLEKNLPSNIGEFFTKSI